MSPQNRHMIAETPEIYKMVVEPYIKSTPASRIQWVYNALEGTAEVERVVLRDEADVETGFVLLPDSKWDCKTLDTLYLQVLVLRRDIRSLRDLTRSHLPLLRNVRDRVCAVVPAKYGVQADELRIFIHYQPSYYHFHIHVTSMRYIAGPNISIGQSHLLDTVIDNIEHIAGDYYQRCTLHYVLGERHPLFERLGVPLSAEKRESEETAEGKNMLGDK
ncbi:HIT-like domain-containing protein [Jimgerdemannia flammicorona]|uniref:m7GpppX diphosphatase n=1 Tax=Jimgerdemannia flammicorona TaxID=994334 RepID=A0A433QJ24_9FUNG|nr:HIT-like domain-containing protein [Jimgerdemannia flammicorona]